MRVLIIITFFFNYFILSAQNNQNISQGTVFDGEPFILVNPYNPQHIVVAWMGYEWLNQIAINVKVSQDGGSTWSNEVIIPHQSPSYTSADVSLAIDNNQIIYLCYIDYKLTKDSGAVYVRQSTDGGYTWSAASKVVDILDDKPRLPIDRPWISVDTSGNSTNGNLYVTTMNAKGALPDYHPYYFVSTNNGISWSPLQTLDTNGWLSGNFIPQPMPSNTISPSGVFYAAYPSYVVSQNVLPQFILAKSSDAGNTFSYNSMFFSTNSVTDSLAKKGYVLKADPSNNNHLIFVYLNKTINDVSDVYFIESFDNGINWSLPLKVNDDNNNRLQDMVWVSFDIDGDIAITWRDRRNATDTTYTTNYEFYAAVKSKDSTLFSQNFALTDFIVNYDSILAGNGNDFMCNQLLNDTLYSVWGDTRSGKLNIWFQKTTVSGQLVSIKNLTNTEIKIYPNPSKNNVTISSPDYFNNITVYNNNGKILFDAKNLTTNYQLKTTEWATGLYFIELKYNQTVIARKKIVVQH